MDEPIKGFPVGVSQPACRALAAAGFTRVEQLTVISQKDLAALHGMGPKALAVLAQALSAQGLAFAPDARPVS